MTLPAAVDAFVASPVSPQTNMHPHANSHLPEPVLEISWEAQWQH
jgi:hypothetical protein